MAFCLADALSFNLARPESADRTPVFVQLMLDEAFSKSDPQFARQAFDKFGSMTILRSVLDSLWSAATRHPFLDAVRDGAIADSAFDRWLVQDALFVGDLLTFQARLLARAPRTAQTVLAGGCVALVAELDWFEDQAARRRINLEQPPLPATLAYRELLGRLDTTPHEAAVTALWALERVYLLAWSSAASDASPFGEFVEHWSAPAFADYVDALGALAIPDRHDELVADVLDHEVAFWDMALA